MAKEILKQLLFTVLMVLTVVPSASQNSRTKVYGMEGDSVNCPIFFSVYREFYRHKFYQDAIDSWRQVFDQCRSFSENTYVDGVTMYRSFIESAPDGPVREGLIDTLMLIYDRRMEFFRGEGNVLGRKGRDLLAYRGSDIEEVQKAYEMLRRSVELEGKESQEAVMVLLITSGVTLNKEGKIDNSQVIEDYITVMELLEQMEGRSSRKQRSMDAVNEIVQKENILSCDALDRYFEPQFEQKKNEIDFLNKVINLYHTAGCNSSDLYTSASENLYSLNPDPESAHDLALLFIARNEFGTAVDYLKEAVNGVGVDNETRAVWYYELALVSSAREEYCDAINYARAAIKLKGDLGKALVLLGDVYIASRGNLGDEFQQRTAYWAAADKYERAETVDPSVAEEARQKLNDYRGQYPGQEDVFFHDLKNGQSFQVGGCINENTTVRAGK
jgi:tetratricopeptide (TPR) repeat protein